MILYLDTSALVKRYFHESYSAEVISKWKDADEIITSSAAYAETIASIYRKKRDADISDKVINKVMGLFQADWQSFIRVEVTDELNDYINKAVKKHPLRGFDAIHLASCLMVNERLPENLLFVCFNKKLTHSAHLEGLETFPQDKQ
jgi:uncharacterized protein